MSEQDGGPAFPVLVRDPWGEMRSNPPGMTQRDYFAAAAMSGLLSREVLPPTYDEMARTAYAQADAMLRARRPA